MDQNQTSRLAWITGGGSGLGRALTLHMVKQGWRVAISGRRAQALEEVRGAAGEHSAQVLPITCDVTDRDQIAAAVDHLLEAFGPPDLCILNAGAYEPFDGSRFSVDAFRHTMEVNYMGAINCVDALLPVLRERAAGHLVFTASVAGYRGLPNAAPYGATKAALIHLAESLKLDLHRFGIDVSVVNPGFVRTPLTEKNDFAMPFIMNPEPAARAMYRGITRGGFEVVFPRRLAWLLKVMRLLPYAAYFPLVRRGTSQE